MRLLLVAAIACGCSAPEVRDAPADAAIDSADSTAPVLDTGTYVYPDAVNEVGDALVRSHDEDSDGYIDEIDSCPFIYNPKENEVLTAMGGACKPIDPFADVGQRVFFDAFTRAKPEWAMSGGEGAFVFRDDHPDLMVGGGANLFHRIAHTRTIVPAGKPVVVTAVMQTVANGGADDTAIGVIARVSTDGNSYIGCNRLNLWITPKGGCPVADDCAIIPVASNTPPSDIADHPVYGLRLSVRDNDDGTVLAECRMFDPKIVASVTGDAKRYAVTKTFAAGTVNADGQAGVFAHHGGVYVYSFEIATKK